MTPGWVIAAFGGEPPAYVHEVVELLPGLPARQWERVRRGRPMERQLDPRAQGRMAKRAAKDQRRMSRWQSERATGLARAAGPVRHLDPSTVTATPPREIGSAVFLWKTPSAAMGNGPQVRSGGAGNPEPRRPHGR